MGIDGKPAKVILVVGKGSVAARQRPALGAKWQLHASCSSQLRKHTDRHVGGIPGRV